MSYILAQSEDRQPVRGPGPEPEVLGFLSDNEGSVLKIVALLGAAALGYYFWTKSKKNKRKKRR